MLKVKKVFEDIINIVEKKKVSDSNDGFDSRISKISRVLDEKEKHKKKNFSGELSVDKKEKPIKKEDIKIISLEMNGGNKHSDNGASKPGIQKPTSKKTLQKKESKKKDSLHPSIISNKMNKKTSGIENEIEYLKEVNRKIIEMIELNSKAIHDIKSIGKGGKLDKNAASTLNELSKKVSDIDSELSLDRAMYPKDIMELQKELVNIKATQKNITEVMESIVAAKKGASDLIPYQKKFEAFEKSIEDVSKRISDASSLKNEIEALKEDIRNYKGGAKSIALPIKASKIQPKEVKEINKEIENIKEVNKKIIEMIEITSTKHPDKNVSSVTGKTAVPELSELSKKVSNLEREMNLDRVMYPQNLMNIQKDINNLKAAQKSMAESTQSSAGPKKGGAISPTSAGKMDAVEKSISGLSEKISEVLSFKDRLESFEKDISDLKASGTSRSNNASSFDSSDPKNQKEILAIKDEIKRIKEVNKSVVEMIEEGSSLKGSASISDKDVLTKLNSISKKVSNLEREMNLDRVMYPKNITEIQKEQANLKATQKSMAEVIESLAERQKRNPDVHTGSESPENNDVIDELEHLKEANEKIIAMIDIHSKTLRNLKNSQGKSEDYEKLSSKVEALSKASGIGDKLNPEKITELEKEMADLKETQKNIAEILESLAGAKKGSLVSDNYKKKFETFEKSLEDVANILSEISFLKEKQSSFEGDIDELRQDLKNLSLDILKSDNEINSKIVSFRGADEIDAIKSEFNSYKKAQEKKLSEFKNAFDSKLKSMQAIERRSGPESKPVNQIIQEFKQGVLLKEAGRKSSAKPLLQESSQAVFEPSNMSTPEEAEIDEIIAHLESVRRKIEN